MAARLNVKFILILFIICATAGGTLVGVAYFKIKNDATRHVRAGDAAMAEGEYGVAAGKYLRAVGKDPTNLEYLNLAIDATLLRTPETTDEARELYMQYVSMLSHGATHRPLDAQQHIRLLEELYTSARYAATLGTAAFWGNIAESATMMEDRLATTDPERVRAYFYRGAARVEPLMFEQLPPDDPDEGTQLEQGVRDLRQFLEARPESDRGWAALIRGLLADAERIRKSGLETDAEARLAEVMETVRAAREAVPNGAETRLISLAASSFEQEYRTGGKADQIDPAVKDELVAEAHEVVQLVEASATEDERKAYLIAELTRPGGVLTQLQWLGRDDLPDPAGILERYLTAHPNHHELRYLEAIVQFYGDELDAAEAQATTIREAPLLTVGLLSQMQPYLKEKAAFIQVKIAFQRINKLDTTAGGEDVEAEREQLLAQLRDRRDELAEMIADTENSRDFIHTEGLVALAERDYDRAAERFSRLVTDWDPTIETLLLAASAVELSGNVSQAAEYVQQLIDLTPDHPAFYGRLARLLMRDRRYEAAREAAAKLVQLERNLEIPEADRHGEQWVELADDALASLDEDTDAVRIALRDTQGALRENDFDAARTLLTEALADAPEDLRLLNGIIRVEIGAGQTDEASRWLEKALEISPGNRTFLGLGVIIAEDDPATRVRDYEYLLGDSDAADAIGASMALLRLARRAETQAAQFEQQNQPERAAEQRELAERARTMMAEEAKIAGRLAPDDPDFLEFRFLEALDREEWPEVERVVARAQELDIDQAGGATFEGRYHLAVGDIDEALRAFREATDHIPYSGSVWRSLALAYEQEGRFDEAVEAFETAYACNRSDLRTVIPFIELLRRVGQQNRALEVVKLARRVAPNDPQLRETWLALEFEVGDRALVLRERVKMYDDDPADRSNAARLAVIYGTVEPTREMLLDKDGNPLFTVDKWSRTRASDQQRILEQARAEWYARADEIVEAMTERDLAWHRLRANLLRARGQVQAGSDVLREWVSTKTERQDLLVAYLALGLYEQSADRLRPAAEAFQEAQAYQTEEGREADVALAALLFKLRQFGPTAQLLEQIIEVRDQPELKLQLLECLVKLDRRDEARELIEELRAENVAENVLVMMEALIVDAELTELHAEGQTNEVLRKFDEFNEILTRAAELNPADPRPHVLRAGGLLKAFQRSDDELLLDEALSELERADRVKADALETGRMRVAVYLAKGPVYTRSAIGELRRILESHPREDSLRMQLIQLLQRDGEGQAALEVAEAAVELDPGSLQWRETLGDLYLSAARDPAMAAQVFGEALALDPNSARLVGKQAESLLSTNPPSVRPALEVLTSHLPMIEANPVLRQVYARAVAMAGNRDEAVKQMRVAYQQHKDLIAAGREPATIINNWMADLRHLGWDGPEAIEAFVTELAGGDPDPVELLGLASYYRVMQQAEGLSRAVELQRLAIEKSADASDVIRAGLFSELGINLLLLERDAEAIEAFLKVIELQPNNARALNNLAHLYAEKMNDPQTALPYAERAVEIAGKNWAMLDTLGRVHYRLNSLDLAERYLRQSIQVQETATNHLHLAQVYRTRNDDDRALRYLERAAELHPDPETQREIDRLSDDIRTSRAGGE
jgi:tetratricopeptide (TPR) repeat protein